MRFTTLVSLTGLLSLIACSDDSPGSRSGSRISLELTPYAQAYNQIGATRSASRTSSTSSTSSTSHTSHTSSFYLTRSWTPPTGYYLYDEDDPAVMLNGMFEAQKTLVDKTIGIFFTSETSDPKQLKTIFRNTAPNKWTCSQELETKKYHLYGYTPHESASATLAAPSAGAGFSAAAVEAGFSGGARLTLNGVDAVTLNDICVVVGAKDGLGENDDNGITTGQFDTQVKATGDDKSNYIYLLFDHLYAALCFDFRVDTTYAELRDIYITKLKMRALNADGTKAGDRFNIVVDLQKTADGSSPILNVTYTPSGGSSDNGGLLYQAQATASGKPGLRLYAARSSHLRGCFAPAGITAFELTSTYDVYDRQGNLIRQGCEAVNRMTLGSLFNSSDRLIRGQIFTIHLTVNPTYLYMLSEPDLDNPKVTLE